MDVSLFDYHLPAELIAQFPVRKRDQSRLMVLNRATGQRKELPFKAVIDFINPGDALVVNNTKVFKARLFGNRATGAKIEIFLVRTHPDPAHRTDTGQNACLWEALVRPSRRVKEGERIYFDSDYVLMEKKLDGAGWLVRFSSETRQKRIISKYGHVPLPHYIRRDDQPSDIRRYQTIFADKNKIGAVAAPTAGFHFTKPILEALKAKGIKIVEVCLHVGPGTFKPVVADDIDDHTVDPEFAELPASSASVINSVREKGGKVFAVGTTTVRTLESAIIKNGAVAPFIKDVDLYIKPGFKFQVVDHLITNFHLPKSSLIILVSAFAGREKILETYREAIAKKFRFYSYGDAMLIL